jgi:hypothetical protein
VHYGAGEIARLPRLGSGFESPVSCYQVSTARSECLRRTVSVVPRLSQLVQGQLDSNTEFRSGASRDQVLHCQCRCLHQHNIDAQGQVFASAVL